MLVQWESQAPLSAVGKRKAAQREREANQLESADPETRRAAIAKREDDLQKKREANTRRRAQVVDTNIWWFWRAHKWCCAYGAAHNSAHCLKVLQSSPVPAGEWYVWMCEECDWIMCRKCCSVPGVVAKCKHAYICIDHEGDIIDERPSK